VQDFDGDPAADVAVLYRRTWPRLIGLLVSIGGSRADAEEVAQDAYVKLLSRWDSIRRYDDPEAWVRAVAVRTLVSRLRRQQVATRALAKLRGRPAEVRGPDGDALDVAAALPGSRRRSGRSSYCITSWICRSIRSPRNCNWLPAR
jgi:DNA-directed RNA polymerase specialized sigma24 family protein